MYFFIAVAVSIYPDGPGLDVCPPVQEDLGGPEEASLSSPVEGSISILSEKQKERQHLTQIHGIQILLTPKYYKHHIYIITYIPIYMYISYTLYRV